MHATSPHHVEWEDLDVQHHDDGVVTVDIPGRVLPIVINVEAEDWKLDDHRSFVRGVLLQEGYLVLPLEFVGYGRAIQAANGKWLWIHLLLYDDIPIHAMSDDRAVHIRVCYQVPGSMRQDELVEIRTQLGEHEHRLAYKLMDLIADELELGLRSVSARALLKVEGWSPDVVAEHVTQEGGV